MMGGTGADLFLGDAGFDTVSYANSSTAVMIDRSIGTAAGGAAGDRYSGIEGFTGSAFNDTLIAAGGDSTVLYALNGGDGNDTLSAPSPSFSGGSAIYHFDGGNGDDVLTGGFRSDVLTGGSGNDTIVAFGDVLNGGGGADVLDGGDGDDTLTGGRSVFAVPSVVTGGAGADHFILVALGNSGNPEGPEGQVITDFSSAEGDKIDLSHITSSVSFIGTDAFTGVAGQLRYDYDAVHDQTLLSLDRNGDGLGDYGETLTGHITLTAGDFLG
jgi:Ca2+-binding RTX toxin-like protein